MICSFCDNEAILSVGHRYCPVHIGFYDIRFFEEAIRDLIDTRDDEWKFFEWAFGTRFPKLSDLKQWYGRIPRPEIPRPETEHISSKRIYAELQSNYIRKITKMYLDQEIK